MSLSSDHPYVRWQAASLEQFGFVNNLLTGIVTAALGFALDHEATLSGAGQVALWLSIVGLFVSGVLGVWCAINRLHDFRETAQIAKDDMSTEEKQSARDHVAALGALSWQLLYAQVLTFGAGAVLCVVAFAL